MTVDFNSADASWYFHENAAAEVARIDSSALSGNLIDAMKNSVVIFPGPELASPPQLMSIKDVMPPTSIGTWREKA